MNLNSIALILRYFTELDSFAGHYVTVFEWAEDRPRQAIMSAI